MTAIEIIPNDGFFEIREKIGRRGENYRNESSRDEGLRAGEAGRILEAAA